MKKLITKTTAAVLCFVFMFAGVFPLATSAETSTSYKICAKDHFSNLHGANKVPPNMDGTCTFVAMSMLLSFYDAYWNDGFVSPNGSNDTSSDLEWQKGTYSSSRDKLYSSFNANDEVEAWNNYTGNIYNFVADNKDKYLQSYLIDMCNELPIIDEFGVLDYQVQDLLERYLYVKRGFDSTEITVNIQYEREVGQEVFVNTMKEQITAGNPVIFFGLSLDILPEELDSDDVRYGGHAMIGYDVTTDENGDDDIILHTGWNGEDDETYRTTDFQFLNSIIWLEINESNLPHVCSNYYYDLITDSNICSCEVYYYTHPTHSIHIYQGFEYYNSETHCYKCGCGYITNIQPHNLTYSYNSPTQHYKSCADCIYSGAENHNYLPQSSSSSSGHGLACVCGATSSTEAHYVHRYTPKNNTYHYKYCECGYLIGTETHDMYQSGIYSICRDCGKKVNTMTDITIKGVEDELDTQTE